MTGRKRILESSRRWWQRYEGDPLPYYVMRLIWTAKVIRAIPWRRWPVFLWNALTYEAEICFDCGRKNIGRSGTYWLADDELWLEVMGSPHGVICPGCFTRRSNAAGIPIHWKPVRGV